MSERIVILGVPIDPVTEREALTRVRAMFSSGGQHHVMTPNPEMLVLATRHPEFAETLKQSSLNVPDGIGLVLVARLLGMPLRERVTGADLLQSVCAGADTPAVFLLGARAGIADRAAAELRRRNPSLRIVGTYVGSPSIEEERDIVRRIDATGATMLFVAYGAPAQDLWIRRNLPNMPSVRVAMGVGGAFDFLSGALSRAPSWMRKIGLEWVWRLLQEPRRIRRIVRAVIVFPFLALTRKTS